MGYGPGAGRCRACCRCASDCVAGTVRYRIESEPIADTGTSVYPMGLPVNTNFFRLTSCCIGRRVCVYEPYRRRISRVRTVRVGYDGTTAVRTQATGARTAPASATGHRVARVPTPSHPSDRTFTPPRCSRAATPSERARRRSTTWHHPYVVVYRAASVARAHALVRAWVRGRAARDVELALPCREAH